MNGKMKAYKDRILNQFQNVNYFMIPPPDNKIRDDEPEDTITYSDLGEEFYGRVQHFFNQHFSSGRLQPKLSNNGDPISVDQLIHMMCGCDAVFTELKSKTTGAEILMVNEATVVFEKYRTSYEHFCCELEKISDDDINSMEEKSVQLQNSALESYGEATKSANEEIFNKYKEQLRQSCDRSINVKLDEKKIEIKQEKLLKDENTKLAKEQYREHMKRFCSSEKNCTDDDINDESNTKHSSLIKCWHGKLNMEEFSTDITQTLASLFKKREEEKERAKKTANLIVEELVWTIEEKWQTYLRKKLSQNSSTQDVPQPNLEALLMACNELLFDEVASKVRENTEKVFWKQVISYERKDELHQQWLSEPKKDFSHWELQSGMSDYDDTSYAIKPFTAEEFPCYKDAHSDLLEALEKSKQKMLDQKNRVQEEWREQKNEYLCQLISLTEKEMKKAMMESHLQPEDIEKFYTELKCKAIESVNCGARIVPDGLEDFIESKLEKLVDLSRKKMMKENDERNNIRKVAAWNKYETALGTFFDEIEKTSDDDIVSMEYHCHLLKHQALAELEEIKNNTDEQDFMKLSEQLKKDCAQKIDDKLNEEKVKKRLKELEIARYTDKAKDEYRIKIKPLFCRKKRYDDNIIKNKSDSIVSCLKDQYEGKFNEAELFTFANLTMESLRIAREKEITRATELARNEVDHLWELVDEKWKIFLYIHTRCKSQPLGSISKAMAMDSCSLSTLLRDCDSCVIDLVASKVKIRTERQFWATLISYEEREDHSTNQYDTNETIEMMRDSSLHQYPYYKDEHSRLMKILDDKEEKLKATHLNAQEKLQGRVDAEITLKIIKLEKKLRKKFRYFPADPKVIEDFYEDFKRHALEESRVLKKFKKTAEYQEIIKHFQCQLEKKVTSSKEKMKLENEDNHKFFVYFINLMRRLLKH